MRKTICFILATLFIVFSLIGVGCSSKPTDPSTTDDSTQHGGGNAEGGVGTETQAEKEYNAMITDLAAFPVNFVYENKVYSGFSSQYFEKATTTRTEQSNIVTTDFLLRLSNSFCVTVETTFYRDYDAYDYTVYFENPSETENSGVLKSVNAIDIQFEGDNAVLKGILGDHDNQYAPYTYDLTKRTVNFTSLAGRATHTYFPYFNLENDNGGALLAIGWGGTWQADFSYDIYTQKTRFVGTGTVGLNTYLKPQEKVRTPLIAVVRYFERDEDIAMNKWRKWVVDCNLPNGSANSDQHVQPFTSTMIANDTGKPNSDGSISEGGETWERSLNAFYSNGLTADFRWVDAGWYFDPYTNTVPSDWWGSVGTWHLDTIKWPNNSFKESVDYAKEHGTKTLLWFEPERVTHLDGMVANYGYNREWVLSDYGGNNVFVNNLGNKDCFEWTLGRILNTMDTYGIDLYREDFNLNPAAYWNIGDSSQGKNRRGITENLYMQGHYALFDAIIDYCGKNGKCTFVDSCASGGGRNDLETIRRSVQLLRSDSDRTTVELRLAMTTRLVRWLPFTGAATKESAGQLTNGVMDTYVLRASMLPHFGYVASFYHEQETIDWETLKAGQLEWKRLSQYFFSDFYVLTPQRSTTDSSNWTVWQYFDETTDSGVVQAFRLPNCNEKTFMVPIKGVDADSYYTIEDIDGVNNITRIKGSTLLDNGIPMSAASSRTAIILYIRPTT